MLVVDINKANFEYDIHSIVKAFYPEEMVKVLTPETGEDKRKDLESDVVFQICITEDGAEFYQKKLLQADQIQTGQEETQKKLEKEEKTKERTATEQVFEKGVLPVEEEVCSSWHYEEKKGDSFKDAFKRFLYLTLSGITGKTLPWGNLTGIRPTKIAYGMLEEKKSHEEILDFMEKSHFVSEKKARLSIEIAERERQILSGVHYEEGYSLYIGIPFCPTTCLYCSFTSFPIAAYRKQVDAYVDCVLKEIDYVAESMKDRILDSVYIGGGTPTTLEPEQLNRLIKYLKAKLDFSNVQEFTVEAGRADSITREKLQVLYENGVGRISVNPQTMKQKTLDIIGRRHTVEQVKEAYHMAREVGFMDINMDLILGLPGETKEDVAETVKEVTALNPDSLTVHSLAIKRASRLNLWIQEHGVKTLNNTDETMDIASKGARSMGMTPYYLYRQKNMSGNFENVGYAKPDKAGLYNILIMEEKQTIVALGAGSITKRVYPDGRIERCDNVKDVTQYIERIDEMIQRKQQLFSEE